MSYLLDKKAQRKRYSYIGFFVLILLILFYFRSGVFNGLSTLSHTVFRPVLVVGDYVGSKFGGMGAYFSSKSSLSAENASLKSQLDANNALMSNYNTVLADDASIKEMLGRKDPKMNMILVAILEKPNQSPYDTLVIDAGTGQGLQVGEMVFAFGNVPIGRIAAVYQNSSNVILFSNSGEQTPVVVGKGISLQAVGRGGGNFEIILPRDYTPVKGDEVVLPGLTPYTLGVVQTIISDPRDPFVKALLASPVNIQELKFVEVKSSK